ncbi:hypothetical protein EDB81DRAFT_811727 [Dactylonectria macrodidyma]|uniref:Uncharacterized protein n=1 Tax=Dactylonectria macrodidyma TaxID=307937 RepID=A0A9P9DSU9_9HYPO|nr:hypothetical protein EDB81DRAFT_811727 [Dactylonectria macrodidyma]
MAASTLNEVQEQQQGPSHTTESSTRQLPAESSGADEKTPPGQDPQQRDPTHKDSPESNAETAKRTAQSTKSERSSVELSLDMTKPRRRETSTTQDAAESATAGGENISKKKSRKKKSRRAELAKASPEKAKETAPGMNLGSQLGEPGFLFKDLQKQPNPKPPSTGGKSSGDALSLRLDLNLEIEIQLKAKIHGDITLTLL